MPTLLNAHSNPMLMRMDVITLDFLTERTVNGFLGIRLDTTSDPCRLDVIHPRGPDTCVKLRMRMLNGPNVVDNRTP